MNKSYKFIFFSSYHWFWITILNFIWEFTIWNEH